MAHGDEITAAPGEQSIALAGSFRLLQPERGHRYSVDDMLVAHLACAGAPAPLRALDLGCGLGSILLITAWAFPKAELVGLEALAEHADLARRNVRLNGCQGRARVVQGDLRDLALVESQGRFDLVTGSPPYFDPRAGTVPANPGRAAAHFELRGGIEAYATAAAATLAPDGRFVGCTGADLARTLAALKQAGLEAVTLQPVVPRAGRAPFLYLFVARAGGGPHCEAGEALVLRDGEGRRTAEHLAIRGWTSVKPRPSGANDKTTK